MGERRISRLELLGYWPILILTLLVMAVSALTVAFNLGG